MNRIGWILGSYFIVAGAFVLSTMGLSLAKQNSIPMLLGFWGLGAFIGGYISAKASRGKTILEPAIGAIFFVASLIGMFLLTKVGKYVVETLIELESTKTTKYMAMVAGCFFVGAFLGAFIGEKVQASRGSGGQPFMGILTFFLTLGGIFVGVFVLLMLSLDESLSGKDLKGEWVLLAMAAGSFIGGFGSRLAGAKILAISLGSLATGGLFLAVVLARGDKDAVLGAGILMVGTCICAILGGVVGKIAHRTETDRHPHAPRH